MSPDSALLMKAVLAGPSEAEVHWKRWRGETDLNRISGECVGLLPVLVARSPAWLAKDPAKNVILGICKRAWTQNQIVLRALAQLIDSLHRAGIQHVAVAGPPAWALIYQKEKSFRPIGFLELLIPRQEAERTVKALTELGWSAAPGCSLPESEALDYVQGMWFQRETGEGLKVSWRLFPAPPECATDVESVRYMDIAKMQGSTFSLLSHEAMLACALAGDRAGDDFDWRCDAILLLRKGKIDWALVKKWIRFSPEARTKLRALARDTDVQIPRSVQREIRPGRLRCQWDMVIGEYRRRAWSRGQRRSFRDFLQFLCERWQAPAWQLPFFGLFYTVRYTLSGRTDNL